VPAIQGTGVAPEDVHKGLSSCWRNGLKKRLELDLELQRNHAADQASQKMGESSDVLDGVAGTLLEGLDDGAKVGDQVIRLAEYLLGEEQALLGGEHEGVSTVFDGVQIAARSAGVAEAKLVITMGTAAGVATHGPGTAVGHLATGLFGVLGHGEPPNWGIVMTLAPDVSVAASLCVLCVMIPQAGVTLM
jgi:hypothetical protein